MILISATIIIIIEIFQPVSLNCNDEANYTITLSFQPRLKPNLDGGWGGGGGGGWRGLPAEMLTDDVFGNYQNYLKSQFTLCFVLSLSYS